ncbi:MAG: hypothetical protein EP343_34680 [Deltaproteobacteria bacterium]|nr:MAG: hypothetical protein EP343_34680 [Deltaproteobacteria bacterium]
MIETHTYIETLLARQKKILADLESSLDSLQLNESFKRLKSPCQQLQDRLNHEEFRVAIVGEFSTGKSTLINTLIKEPDLLPSDELPCTSQAIELHYGEHYDCVELSTGKHYSNIRQALKEHTTVGGQKRSSVGAHRWQLSIPSGFLSQGMVFIDTPGIGEDKERHDIAFEEANKADAVVLVTNATRVGTETESELVSFIAAQNKPVILAINYIDQVRSDPERFRDRAIDIFHPHLDQDNIVLLSGLKAHNELTSTVSQWTEMLESLRNVIFRVLQENSAGERIKAYQLELESLESTLSHELQTILRQREHEKKQVEQLIQDIEKSLHRGKPGLKTSLQNSFYRAWPGILGSLDRAKSSWKSEYSPVFSPKKYATQIANQAKRHIEQKVRGWATGQGKRATEQQVQNKLNEIEPLVSQLTTYLNYSGQSSASLQNRLLSDVMHRAFNKSIDSAADDAAWATIVAAIVSTIVGYIIADVILFYVLAAISGFLNPVLLVAAALVGLTAFFMGQDYVGNYVKSKIVEKIQEELVKSEAKNKINRGFEQASEEVFGKLSQGFGIEARRLQSDVEQKLITASQTVEQVHNSLSELRTMFSSQ